MAWLSILNRLLPFATPGTPLIQDLLHLAAICTLLYFAPQIQEHLQTRPAAQDSDSANVDPTAPEGREYGDTVPENDLEDDTELNRERADDVGGRDIDDAQILPEGVAENGHPGLPQAANVPPQRNMGTKKAKSLARRDQRRAYNEFMRSQGEAQRARDAEGAAEREAALAAEKERRRAAEAALEAKRAKEREHRRQREESERMQDIARRELAVTLVKEALEARNMCDLFRVAREVGDDVDEEWIESLLKAVGLVGRKGDTMTMVTGMGWAVRVREADMAKLYSTVAENGLGGKDGRVEHDELGPILETILCG